MKDTNEGKKKGAGPRLNLLDVAILLLIIFCAVGIWQNDNLERLFGGTVSGEYQVTFEITGGAEKGDPMPADTILYILHDGGKYRLGTVITGDSLSLDSAPNNGETVGIFLCHLTARGGRYSPFNGFYLAVGDTLSVVTEAGEFQISVLDIELIS